MMNFGLLEKLMIVHLLICVIYIVFFRKRILKFLFPVVLFVPYLGAFSILAVHFGAKIGKKEREFEIDEVFLESEKMEYISQIDGDKEMNIVPVEEALLINDNNVQRSMVVEIAKRDPLGYLKNLKRALLSDDTETAHYAASSITELKRSFEKETAVAEKNYKQNPSSSKYRHEYIEVIDQILKADLLIDSIRERYKITFVELLIEDIEKSEKARHSSYQMLCDYYVEKRAFEKALNWIERYQKAYPRSDIPLGLKLELAYANKDTVLFKQTIQELDGANFPITQKTKRIIEFWMGENNDGQ